MTLFLTCRTYVSLEKKGSATSLSSSLDKGLTAALINARVNFIQLDSCPPPIASVFQTSLHFRSESESQNRPTKNTKPEIITWEMKPNLYATDIGCNWKIKPFYEAPNLIENTASIHFNTFISQKVLFAVNLTSIGKNKFGSAAGTTNSIDPLEQETNQVMLVVKNRETTSMMFLK